MKKRHKLVYATSLTRKEPPTKYDLLLDGEDCGFKMGNRRDSRQATLTKCIIIIERVTYILLLIGAKTISDENFINVLHIQRHMLQMTLVECSF
jgi:hypothetical protein